MRRLQIRSRGFELQVGGRSTNVLFMAHKTRILFRLYINFADFSRAGEPSFVQWTENYEDVASL